MFYFGTDKDAALAEYLRVKEAREAGLEPPPKGDEWVTFKALANTFLTHKRSAVAIGELTERSFRDYLATCEGMATALGKETAIESITTEALLKYRRKLAERLGPVALGNEVNRCRVVFNVGFQ